MLKTSKKRILHTFVCQNQYYHGMGKIFKRFPKENVLKFHLAFHLCFDIDSQKLSALKNVLFDIVRPNIGCIEKRKRRSSLGAHFNYKANVNKIMFNDNFQKQNHFIFIELLFIL